MEVIAKSKYIRLSPRKLNLVAAAIRNLTVAEAEKILNFLNKKGSHFLLLVLKQGKANAIKNFNLQEKSLKIKRLIVTKGPSYKRGRPVSRGRWHPILKRTSHVIMILEGDKVEKNDNKGKKSPVVKAVKNNKITESKDKKKGKEKKNHGSKS